MPDELIKHARVVELDEIEENEFNLNIPRYVDTFEPEPVRRRRLPRGRSSRAADADVQRTRSVSSDDLLAEHRVCGRLTRCRTRRDWAHPPVAEASTVDARRLVVKTRSTQCPR